MNRLYGNPIITTKEIAKIIKQDERTASRLINDMSKSGIIKEFTGNIRHRNYVFADYLDIFSD